VTGKPSTFVRSALASGLVTQDQIDQARQSLRAAGGLGALPAVGVGDDLLAAQLTEMKLLTPYQCQQLKAGRTKLSLGPYIVTDWLGQGGMGQVFVAMHQIMHRQVAIKVLPRSKSTPAAIASFKREIQTQAKLDHRNLVRAYDAGHDGNVYFLVTEYVAGTDLRRLVRSQGRLTMAQTAAVISQAAQGLGYAHEQGLVHRDVKPGNLLVTPEGLVKVSDLGLAGFLHEAADDPRTGKIVGTADYLAPEIITQPQSFSPVSDIYALGCTLYYAVTGKVPFPGGSTRDKARRHCEETPWHPRQFNADVSDEFVDLIADMLEKQPRLRLQTAAEVVERLKPWADQHIAVPLPVGEQTRWSAPPVPMPGRDETVDDLGDLASEPSPSRSTPSGSTFAEPPPPQPRRRSPTKPTDGTPTPTPVAARTPAAAPRPGPQSDHDLFSGNSADKAPLTPRRAVVTALSIAVPLAMAAGGLLTWLFLNFLSS
jgi:serine/threonine protein kinase